MDPALLGTLTDFGAYLAQFGFFVWYINRRNNYIDLLATKEALKVLEDKHQVHFDRIYGYCDDYREKIARIEGRLER